MDNKETVAVSILDQMKALFSDIPYFTKWVVDNIENAINDIEKNVIQINFATVKKFAHRYYATGRFVTKEEIDMWKEIQWIFTTCCVLIVAHRPEVQPLFWKDTEKLVEKYPSFANVKKDDLEVLLKFRNMVAATLTVVSPRHNKQLILYIAGRLEGSQKRYVTGSGMSEAVKRRVLIYEQEGGVEPEARPERCPSVKNQTKPLNFKQQASIQFQLENDAKKLALLSQPTNVIEAFHPLSSVATVSATAAPQSGNNRFSFEPTKSGPMVFAPFNPTARHPYAVSNGSSSFIVTPQTSEEPAEGLGSAGVKRPLDTDVSATTQSNGYVDPSFNNEQQPFKRQVSIVDTPYQLDAQNNKRVLTMPSFDAHTNVKTEQKVVFSNLELLMSLSAAAERLAVPVDSASSNIKVEHSE